MKFGILVAIVLDILTILAVLCIYRTRRPNKRFDSIFPSHFWERLGILNTTQRQGPSNYGVTARECREAPLNDSACQSCIRNGSTAERL